MAVSPKGSLKGSVSTDSSSNSGSSLRYFGVESLPQLGHHLGGVKLENDLSSSSLVMLRVTLIGVSISSGLGAGRLPKSIVVSTVVDVDIVSCLSEGLVLLLWKLLYPQVVL